MKTSIAKSLRQLAARDGPGVEKGTEIPEKYVRLQMFSQAVRTFAAKTGDLRFRGDIGNNRAIRRFMGQMKLEHIVRRFVSCSRLVRNSRTIRIDDETLLG